MIKIGITGGIGSGKTTVCKIFETLGVPIYYADERAKWLMVNSPVIRIGIQNLFGEKAFDENGQLNRSHISGIVFKILNSTGKTTKASSETGKFIYPYAAIKALAEAK